MPELNVALGNLVPSALADIDYAGGTATVDGESVVLADQIATDSDYGVTYDTAHILAGVGYQGPQDGFGGGKFSGELATAMAALSPSYAVMFDYFPLDDVSAVEIDFRGPGYTPELYFSSGSARSYLDQPSAGSSVPKRNVMPPSYGHPFVGTGTQEINRVVLMVTPDYFAAAMIGYGPAVQPRRHAAAIDTWLFQVNNMATIRRIGVFDAVKDTVTLQAIAALGLDS